MLAGGCRSTGKGRVKWDAQVKKTINKASKASKASKARTRKAPPPSETTLVLRTCAADMTAYNGFKWPRSGHVEAPDYKPAPVCGNGLHGLAWGSGDWSNLSSADDAVWMVVEVPTHEIIDIQNKVKFRSGNVVFCGSRVEATIRVLCGSEAMNSARKGADRWQKEHPHSTEAASSGCGSKAASSGCGSKAASSGDSSTAASSGDSSKASSSGDRSTAASSGDSSTAASSGDSSTAASSGCGSKAASSGYGSTAASSGDS